MIFQKLAYYEIVDIRILTGLSLLLFQDFNNFERVHPWTIATEFYYLQKYVDQSERYMKGRPKLS